MSVTWESDTLTPGMREFPNKLLRALSTLAEFHSDRAITKMRSNASWNDQTGNARNGLNSASFSRTNKITIVMFHSVPYGIWLEVRWSGRYRIIVPTVKEVGREYMTDCRKFMRRMR
jgi:hypothetical protein